MAKRGKRSTKNDSPSPSSSSENNAVDIVGDHPASDTFRHGLRVTSRIHRACTPCRRQKMRCEGPMNGPCNRCKATQKRCVFEPRRLIDRHDAVSTSAKEHVDRLDAIEQKIGDVYAMMSTFVAVVDALKGTAGTIESITSRGSTSSSSNSSGNTWCLDTSPSSLVDQPTSERILHISDTAMQSIDTFNCDACYDLKDFDFAFVETTSTDTQKTVLDLPSQKFDSLNFLGEEECKRLWENFYQANPLCASLSAGGAFSPRQMSESNSYDASGKGELNILPSYCLVLTALYVAATMKGNRDRDERRSAILSSLERRTKAYVTATLTMSSDLFTITTDDVISHLLLAAYAGSGVFVCAHAIRMAQCLKLDRSYARLLGTITASTEDSQERRTLVKETRIWLLAFVLDHLINNAAGRTPVLRNDSVAGCRAVLQLPASLLMRQDYHLVASAELMIIREQCRADVSVSSSSERIRDELRQWSLFWRQTLLGCDFDEHAWPIGSLHSQYASVALHLETSLVKEANEATETLSEDGKDRHAIGCSPNHEDITGTAQRVVKAVMHDGALVHTLAWLPFHSVQTLTHAAVILIENLYEKAESHRIDEMDANGRFQLVKSLAIRLKASSHAGVYGEKIERMLRLQGGELSMSPGDLALGRATAHCAHSDLDVASSGWTASSFTQSSFPRHTRTPLSVVNVNIQPTPVETVSTPFDDFQCDPFAFALGVSSVSRPHPPSFLDTPFTFSS